MTSEHSQQPIGVISPAANNIASFYHINLSAVLPLSLSLVHTRVCVSISI